MFFPLSGFTLMKGCRSKAAPTNREVHVEHRLVVLWGFAGWSRVQQSDLSLPMFGLLAKFPRLQDLFRVYIYIYVYIYTYNRIKKRCRASWCVQIGAASWVLYDPWRSGCRP